MMMMRFFTDEVLQVRYPRSMVEGALKGYMLGGALIVLYDALTPWPETSLEMASRSQTIVGGYAIALILGALCGYIERLRLQDNEQGPRQIQR